MRSQKWPGLSRIATISALVLLLLGGFAPNFVSASERVDSTRNLYDRVMVEFRRGDYEAAMAGFRFFLDLHGKSALAANAQYWIGECQYKLGRYKDALNSFSKVGSINPLSPKLAAAEFKIGQTYAMLGDYYRARVIFDEVLDHYPGGAEAKLAQKAIDGVTLKIDSKPAGAVKTINTFMP